MAYDSKEATQILARTAGKLVPHPQTKHTESAKLLEALVALNGVGGFTIAVHGNGVEVQVGSRRADVRYGEAEGSFIVGGRGGRQSPVPLRFNPVLNRFEGETDDTYLNPQPGQPTPPREALAVLVDAICRALL